MIGRLGPSLLLAVCAIALSACVIAPGPVYGRAGGVWVPAHYNGWHWVPGHWA